MSRTDSRTRGSIYYRIINKDYKNMRLTDEQFNALLPYEKNFETMVKSKWARNPGSSALDLIHRIYCEVTGTNQKFNKGCQHCIMRLLTDMGKIFLADLEERNKPVEEIPEPVEETPEEKPKKKRSSKKSKNETD